MKSTDMKLLGYLQEMYDEALELTKGSRAEGALIREYKRGNQLPEDVAHILQQRGQPLRWENIISEMDTSLGGIMQMSKMQMKVTSRSHTKDNGALVREQIHRAAMDSTQWWSKKAKLDEDLRMEGISCVAPRIVWLDEFDTQGKRLCDIDDEHLPANECLIDMYHRKDDYSDARYFHHSRMYDKRMILRKFSNKKDDIKNISENKRGMIRLHRTWYKDEKGDVRVAIWADGVILEDIAQSYEKLKGRIGVAVRVLNYIKGVEYSGMYRNIIPLQDDVNFSMLRVKNMLSSIKVIIEASGVDDVDTFMETFAKDNSVSVVNDGTLSTKRIEVINLSNNIAQIMSLVQDTRVRAKQIMGISPELLGTSTTRQSGVAIQMKQNAGLVGFQPLISASHDMSKDVFKLHSALMEQYYTAETVFAITGRGDEIVQFLVNEYERNEKGGVVFEKGIPKQKNILSAGRYDYTIVEVPWNDGSPDAKIKGWAEILKNVDPKYAVHAMPVVMRDIGSPQSEEMIDIIKKVDAQEAEAAQQSQGNSPEMAQMQLQMKEMAEKINEMNSKANLNNAKAEEIRAKTPPTQERESPISL